MWIGAGDVQIPWSFVWFISQEGAEGALVCVAAKACVHLHRGQFSGTSWAAQPLNSAMGMGSMSCSYPGFSCSRWNLGR
jgi:hypothetical protein